MPANGLFLIRERSDVLDQAPNLLFCQPNVQEGMWIALMTLALSGRDVEVLVAGLLDARRAQVRNLHFAVCRGVPAAVGGMATRTLLGIEFLGVLGTAFRRENEAQSREGESLNFVMEVISTVPDLHFPGSVSRTLIAGSALA